MTPLLIFNSTILVLWFVMVVPHALKTDNKKLLWISGTIILTAEILLCLAWANRDFPINLLVAFANFSLAMISGRIMHEVYQRTGNKHS
jgi:hypothetical protein